MPRSPAQAALDERAAPKATQGDLSSCEPRDDTPEGRAYWREYGRAEREHAELRNERVRANVQRSTVRHALSVP